MIQPEQYTPALRALQRLVVHGKSLAYAVGASRLAGLLNDVELLPEFIADEADRTADFIEMLESIARVNPDCRYILEEFTQTFANEST